MSRHTAVPEDVNLRWDSISSWPRCPNLYQGMSEVFRHWDIESVLVGQIQGRNGVRVLPVKHLLEDKFEFRVLFSLQHIALEKVLLHSACTLYPVTADSSPCATTGSHLMLTPEPEKVQEMLPGGLLGARKYKIIKKFSEAEQTEEATWRGAGYPRPRGLSAPSETFWAA